VGVAVESMTSPPIHRARPRASAAIFAGVVVVVGAAGFIGFDIGRPIGLWDESRLAVNALEMSQRGVSLVTTYGFAPDLWNTKPPLLIWLMAGAIRLFGAQEWAIRLPSLVAAVATVALTLWFAWRLTASLRVMAVAGLTLAVSAGFYGYHAAMTGDYDALLTLFVTAYVFLLFDVLHRRRPSAVAVVACSLLVAAACLTKGVAGVVPGVGVGVYVLARGRWRRLLETPWYGLAGLLAAAIVVGFYAAREALAPGYLAAVMSNELGGRYLLGMGGHIRPVYYYLQMLAEEFAFGPLFVLPLVAMALPWKRTPSAAFLAYANAVTATLVIVLTLGRTKIYWYLDPLYPVLSVGFAVSMERILALTDRHGPRWWRTAILGRVDARGLLVGLALTGVLLGASHDRFVDLPPWMDTPQGRYGRVFASLDSLGIKRIRTVDAGVYNNDDLTRYTPQLRFYTLVWRARGLDILADDADQPAPPARDTAVVTCDPNRLEMVRASGAPLVEVRSCAVVTPRSGG
jgi:4-amino-4-deoxy-L-arabinose transferase-like glycosyltransferase